MILLSCLLIVALALRAADRFYYRDHDRVLRMLRLLPRGEGLAAGHARPLDGLYCWFPFLWIWCDVAAALTIGRLLGNLLAWLAVAVIVGGRFRALQEVAHTAVHSGLCKSRRYQWAIADVLVSWPLFRPDVHHRYIGHVTQHHLHANEPDKDPNIARFVSVGMVPGIGLATWRRRLWFPLTPRGFAETGRNLLVAVFVKNVRPARLPARFLAAAAFALAVWVIGGTAGLLLGFLLPLVTVYPLFSWISVLAEHRWFVRCEAADRKTRECTNGRPTDYRGPVGTAVKHVVFPFSDHYHLAHSLYPAVRWNHLAAVDRALKAAEPRYGRYVSLGLFRPAGPAPTALSELRDRLVDRQSADLAGWAADLRPGRSVPEPVAV